MRKSKNKKKVEVKRVVVTYDTIILHDFVDGVMNENIDPMIYEEFMYKIRDKEQTYISKLIKDINALQHKYNLVKLIVKEFYLHKRIQAIQPDCPLPDLEETWKVLISIVPARKTDTNDVIMARASKLLADIKMKEVELKQLQPVTEGGRADNSYFNRMIASVGVYHKIQINRMTMLLAEFVEYLLIMREQQNYMESESKKQKR